MPVPAVSSASPLGRLMGFVNVTWPKQSLWRLPHPILPHPDLPLPCLLQLRRGIGQGLEILSVAEAVLCMVFSNIPGLYSLDSWSSPANCDNPVRLQTLPLVP